MTSWEVDTVTLKGITLLWKLTKIANCPAQLDLLPVLLMTRDPFRVKLRLKERKD